MTMESLSPGCHVVLTKMQIIGTVIKEIDDFVCVRISKDKPPEVWKRDELTVWNGKEEIQKKLKQGGCIRDIFLKMTD
jgi:hypothetical protein